MRKICAFLFIGVFIVMSVAPVFAVDPPANTAGQKYFCLMSTRSGTHDATITLDPKKPSPASGLKMYVLVKINNLLTTGNTDLDAKIFGNNQNYDTLRTTIGFDNKGIAFTGPKMDIPIVKPAGGWTTHEGVGVVAGDNPVADPSTLNVKWHDFVTSDGKGNTSGIEHFWFGMQYVNPGAGGNNGTAGGQQQGTFKWALSVTSSDCAMIKWDPLGIVFDAETLGVIPGATVTIFDATKTPPVKVPMGAGKGQVATNPFTTLENGSFSFFTDPGSYSMTIDGMYNNKPLVIASAASINSGYKTMGYTNLYNTYNDSKQPIMEEEGQTVRTDIAVNTVGAPPRPLLTPSFVGKPSLNGNGEMIQISGGLLGYTPDAPNVKVVVLYTNTKTQQTKESPLIVPLDAFGGFNFHAPQALESDPAYTVDTLDLRPIQRVPTAQNKNLINRFINKMTSVINTFFVVHAAQSMSLNIDPIPSYLEGIAKDSNGVVLPSALVGVYILGSDIPAYQTKSDVNGHYVIGSQYIPSSSYEIRIAKVTGEVIKMSTKEYLAQNATYHQTNSVNSFSTVIASSSIDSKTSTLMVTKTVVPQSARESINSNSSSTGKSQSSNTSSRTEAQTQQPSTSGGDFGAGMQGVAMIIAAILVLIMVGIGAFIMMKSKQSQLPPQY